MNPKKLLGVVEDITDVLPVALDVLEALADALPAAEEAAVKAALKTVRVLLEEGENTADAIRKVRELYSQRAQEIADTFTH